MTLFNTKKSSNLPPAVGYNTYHTDERKKRTSITNFFHPPSVSLKRRHEDDDTQDAQEQENKRKKTAAAAAAAAAANMKNHLGTMSRLFQRIAVTVNRSARSSTPRQDPQPEFVDIFQTMKLPTIEWTNGDLGILPSLPPLPQPSQTPRVMQEKVQLPPQPLPQPLPQPQLQLPQEKERDSVFCINDTEFMEFPVPPLLKTVPKRRVRQDSCPPKFNSLIIIEEEETSDDDESMPSTPFNDPISYDESHPSNKIQMLGLS
ncbi:hypothetical protein [Parasitella parasitica]|uniref:Uncharacterized protein n=1 Tax=Parasitella parasitica TaxID=35722 RepID=A0A0B7NUC2_9FUNG|nr:hypothetical protein [Parasitella parasitica]